MKLLQAIWDGGGNTAPQLAIGRELLARGHEVTVLGNRVQRERIEREGLRFRAYRRAPDADSSSRETDLLRDWEARTPLGAFARLRDRLMYGPSGLFARDVLDALDADSADLVVWDYLLLGAGLGAERAGLPSVAVIHHINPIPREGVPPFGPGFAPANGKLGELRDALVRRILERSFMPGLAALNRARADLGLDPLEGPFDQLLDSDLVLVLTSTALDFEGTLPPNVRYTGPALGPAGSAEWDSPWAADDERPLVVASFSTTYMDQQDLAARTVEALAELPVRGLLTAGRAIDPARLPAAPNVEVREFVSHSAVFDEASLVVTHAGMGTVHAALAAGVPLLCIPDGRDQNDIAIRVATRGAGIHVRRGARARAIRRAIEAALADEGLRREAERLGQVIRSEDGAARSADALEAVVATARHRARNGPR
jgi:MGT family glycosyltransferase